jgi:hypothetical protein
MTKTLAIILLTSSSVKGIAQNVNIPDANFKAYLVGNTAINTNNDTEIQISEAQSYTGSITCTNLGISDLTGIEAFTAITNLNCTDNQITTLDLSQNVALSYLSVYNNNLTSLDVGQISSLNRLWCMFNPITSLDLSQNGSLVFVQTNNCSLTSLNLANGNNTNFIGVSSNNNNLTCIQVDNAVYSNSNWTSNDLSKDVGASYSENCSSTSYVQEIGNSAINLYPNPTNGIIPLQSNLPQNINIFSMEGKLLDSFQLFSQIQYDMCELNNGIYLVQTENGATQKFIKQ